MHRLPESSRRPSVVADHNADAVEARRIDQLAQAVDCCIEAKRLADGLGEKLLAYLLAMAIQETRSAMREDVDLRSRSP